MSNFWPSGLELSDTQSPMEVLESAQNDWVVKGEGVMALILQKTVSTDGYDMIVIHANHIPTNRTVTLFTVVHRPDTPYPATIQLKDDDLPDFLKKSYYQSGTAHLGSVISEIQGREVTNRWVSNTPSEFRAKLIEVFNLGLVKTAIVSLLTNAPLIVAGDSEETTGKQADEN